MLEVRLLGQFQIHIDGKTVTIPFRAEQSLLAYLILNAGTAFRREHLSGLLWPDSDEANAKGYLRQALWRLRKAIHECAPSAPDYFQANKISIAFDPNQPYWLDCTILLNEAQAGLEDLLSATQTYTGELLPGFYDEWVMLERERLQAVFNRQMQRLLEQLQSANRWGDLIQQAERWIFLGDHPEPAYRALILGHARSGDLSGALAAYERCAITLERDLGVKPSAETQALIQKIQTEQRRSQALPLSLQKQIKTKYPAFLDEEFQRGDIAIDHFVGRESQLARLERVLQSTLSGQSQVAFVSAEAGMGKTSLLTNFSRQAQEKYPRLIVASGICTIYTKTGDAYLPFREILRMLSADIEGMWAAGNLTRDHALRLWRLLPVALEALVSQGQSLVGTFLSGQTLNQRAAAHETNHPELIDQLQGLISIRQETRITQERIFEQYTDVLTQIARKSPLLLILDDLHWADTSSINLLFHLGRRLARSPILILGAYRPEEVNLSQQEEKHPLADVLSEFKRLFGDIRITLDHKDNEEARRFVDALLDDEPNRLGEIFREQLTHNTQGHPLFTVEMLREMQERGDILQDGSRRWIESPGINWDNLPGRVEGVIEKRVNRLAPQQKKALVTASVEGEDFCAEVIAQVRGMDGEVVVRMLSEDLGKRHNLVQARSVEQSGEQRISRYQFGHNLFQKYLYSTLDPVERVFQHEAVGNALEKLYQGRSEVVAVQLARHFQEARIFEKAIQYLKQAGDAAQRVYANTEAIAHYSRAIQLAEQVHVNDENIIELYIHLGRVLELDSAFDQALSTYEKLGELAVQRANPAMELASLMARVGVLAVPSVIHNPGAAFELGERALNLARELDDPAAEAKILWSLLIPNLLSGHLEESIACGERSLALARQFNLLEQTAQTLSDLGGFPYLYTGRIDQARQALGEASELWHKLGNKPMLADSLSKACIAHLYAGDYDQAINFSEEAFQISHDIKNIWGQSYSKWMVGEAYRERGEYSKAIEVMEECIRLGKQAGILTTQDYTRIRLGATYMDLGCLDRGLQAVEQGLALARAQDPIVIIQGLGVLARLQILKGNLTAAGASIAEGQQDPYQEQETWVFNWLTLLFAEAELALRQRESSRALAVTEDLIARLRRYNMRLLLPEALYLQGKVLLDLNQDAEARERFVEAQSIARAINSRRTLWRISLALSKLEEDPEISRELLQEACRVLEFILAEFKEKHRDLREIFIKQADVKEVMAKG